MHVYSLTTTICQSLYNYIHLDKSRNSNSGNLLIWGCLSFSHRRSKFFYLLLLRPTDSVNHCKVLTCPCFQHSLKSFQLLLFLWSLSHKICWSQIQECGISLYNLLFSFMADFRLSLGSSLGSDFTFILAVLFGGILFSTTEAMMSSRMLGIVRPLLPLY